jgi:hypothetical protein
MPTVKVPTTDGPGSCADSARVRANVDGPPSGDGRRVNRTLATTNPTTAPSPGIVTVSGTSVRTSRYAVANANTPSTIGIENQNARILPYVANASDPPSARPTPITAPVTVNAAGIG